MATANTKCFAQRVYDSVRASCGAIADYTVPQGDNRTAFVKTFERILFEYGAERVEAAAHQTYEDPIARARIFSLWKCRDRSMAAVFASSAEIAHHPKEVLRTKDNRFAGVWDGERVEVLDDAVRVCAMRERATGSMADFVKTLTIPRNRLADLDAQEKNYYAAKLGEVLAADANGGMLCADKDGSLQVVTRDYLRRQEGSLVRGIARQSPGSSLIVQLSSDLASVRQMMNSLGEGPRFTASSSTSM